MTKTEALSLFKTGVNLARALRISPQAVSNIPDGVLAQKWEDRIVGACVRLGIDYTPFVSVARTVQNANK